MTIEDGTLAEYEHLINEIMSGRTITIARIARTLMTELKALRKKYRIDTEIMNREIIQLREQINKQDLELIDLKATLGVITQHTKD